MNIFMTGGTGFLGTEMAGRLAKMTDTRLYVLVRANSEKEAYHRLRSSWHRDESLCKSIGENVFPVVGDFTMKGLGLSSKDTRILQDSISLVIHSGAEIGFQKDERELRAVNGKGTENMLNFAGSIKNLYRFVHISTAYVAGQKKGVVMEDDTVGDEFSSIYEKSKAEAEMLVRISGLPYSICRPGMIVGNSADGYVKNFNTVYYVLKMFLLGRLPLLPIRADAGINLVPVDYVAEAALMVAFSHEAEGKTFHLTCPEDMQPRAAELARHVRSWAKRNLDLNLQKPRFVPLHALGSAGLAYNRKAEGRKKGNLSNMLTLLPYFFSDQKFDRTNTDAVVGKYTLRWRSYIDDMLDFACRKNFMRQSGDTVFEQAKKRRASKRYPVNYYDVTADGIEKVTGPEANERIEKITDALWAWGVRKGDRVALTGINTVDYMTIDQAIGMLGAVSVPIYYTTPPDEASMLIKRSGAKWFFIGDKRIMQKASELKTDAKIVAFSVALDDDCSGVMTWSEFLAKADGPAPKQFVDPEDLATIRFTSGTTGDPKGVMFSYSQLAWMGEVMTNLFQWEDRNRAMRYLSFLPQSHVVEGILASYAPYYMLVKADFYYLNDFGALVDALPKVRPSVFFSVPRFYEKLWDQLSENRFGKAWLEMKDGPSKKAAGAVLKRLILRKAGLDACKQLIVGSAPVSEELLLKFRELGIEIHNAYGQTEAPLITINRLGDNIIPTIGTPLPETEVTLTEDGELLVKGPQVTSGYYGLETDTVQDGILKTGDLGTIHENGHITLHGRKKDMIVTAYGKNISIPKIEERLKDIPGVSEAVLIGENRPYCTALLWLEEGGTAGGDATTGAGKGEELDSLTAELDDRIRAVNENLSHPEQIRKFTVIPKPLSISEGELTPNLKVKRANVQEHFRDEIEEMYK